MRSRRCIGQLYTIMLFLSDIQGVVWKCLFCSYKAGQTQKASNYIHNVQLIYP